MFIYFVIIYLLFILTLTLNLIFQISSVIASSSWFSGFFFKYILIHSDSMDMNMSKVQERVKDREAWSATVCRVSESQT